MSGQRKDSNRAAVCGFKFHQILAAVIGDSDVASIESN